MHNFIGLSLFVALSLFMTSCGDDDPVNPAGALGPEITLEAGEGFLSTDSDVIIGNSFSVKLKVSKGDSALQSVKITYGSDNTNLPTDRFTINDGAITSNNPFLVPDIDKDGATYEIKINPGTEMVEDLNTYTFTVTDKLQKTAFTDIQIKTIAEPFTGTPIDSTLTGVLFNQAGPSGTGGLDLDQGEGTGSSDASAEIRDLGIDCTIPVTQENWRRRFGTLNGATMVKVDATQVEGFTFDGVDKKEQIADAYNSGIDLADGISYADDCTETPVTDATEDVAEGDMFVVQKDGVNYLIRVDEVNYVHSATNFDIRNDDNYVFSIKY